MEIQAAISKINRYASLEQGNSVEVIERPNGGISIVMAEGRLENRRSSAVTMKAAHDILALIAEGVHDGASARVVLSRIKNEHHEKASVAVSIISCDLETKTIVITKNSSIPILTCDHAENRTLPINSDPDELRYNPSVYQFELVPGQIFILISEGVFNAGSNSENLIDLNLTLGSLLDDGDEEPTVQEIADFILRQAISHDSGRPRDDMTVVVLKVLPGTPSSIRREYVSFPIDDNN
ncbi:MAG: SpoIIE family protein phosphatase [Chloroflexi bacterium]|jgi:serine/threonine protein phosphatase PrpC|nr:SpoIIE family protein phosphatase [Chloroflexota bacterium]